MRGRFKKTTVVLLVACILGLCLLLYPTVANYWNTTYATHMMSDYSAKVHALEIHQYKDLWDEAKSFNEDLQKRYPKTYSLTEEQKIRYNQCLNVAGTGVMGIVEIPKIGVSLPLYHGTSDPVLQSGIGHVEWSSLPTGGDGTHCVISGHRGLPSAKMLTDLDELREGDIFSLSVLDAVITYEVDQIRTVDPDDVRDLKVEDGKDYCTIVTCTPYGVNTHRLLVRGHRVETVNHYNIISEAVIVDPLIVASIMACPILFMLLMAVLLKKPETRKKNVKGGEHEKTL